MEHQDGPRPRAAKLARIATESAREAWADGNAVAAAKRARRALRHNPGAAEAHVILARALLRMGDPWGARWHARFGLACGFADADGRVRAWLDAPESP